MQKTLYPIGIQSFEEIRKNGFVYIDKTRYIYELAATGKYYFLSRPRRFGKSLLLSTTEALFRGKRELFDGLFIASTPWEWHEWPIIHIDFNGSEYPDRESLYDKLHFELKLIEDQYAVENENENVSERFSTLILKLKEKFGRNVVVLIDEYDKPLVDNLFNHELQEQMRGTMQAFFSVLKSFDSHLRFAMLTGVSRFSKVSVFSGLNNLNDISIDQDYNAICGITEIELESYFKEGIEDLAECDGRTAEEVHAELKKRYDGYHFSKKMEDVYNPFSMLNVFWKRDFGSYWFRSGTPTFLVRMLEKSDRKLISFEDAVCSEEQLMGSEIYSANPLPLLYQTGYLTIKSYSKEYREYTLGFPNEEVEEGFSNSLLKSYGAKADPSVLINDFVKDVNSGDAESFMSKIQSFLADCPDSVQGTLEIHWQNVMYTIMKLMGLQVQTEYRMSDGRIDMVVKTRNFIYVMEFKLKGTAKKAMEQIDSKEYTLPFRTDGRRIIKIGAAFSARSRRLSRWIIEED